MKNQKNSSKTALITGASSGIGYELAKQFAKNGYSIVAVAQNESRLESSAENLRKEYNVEVITIAKDLSHTASAQEIFTELKNKNIIVEVLVNNAGFTVLGKFSETNTDEILRMMQVNMVTLTYFTRLILAEMVERRSGKILNVASTAAFQPGPFMSVYYASKAYVLMFSEALAIELKDSGVSMTTLCPGATKTNFAKSANMLQTKLFKDKGMKAHIVAAKGYNGMMRGKSLVIPGLKNKFFTFGVRFIPRKTAALVAKHMHKMDT